MYMIKYSWDSFENNLHVALCKTFRFTVSEVVCYLNILSSA